MQPCTYWKLAFTAHIFALDSINGFCSNFNNRSLKPVSIEIQINIYERAPVHVLKSLRAQLIALHYMNGFCPNFSCRLLKPKSIERWLGLHIQERAPKHVLESLCVAQLIALHYRNGFHPVVIETQIHRKMTQPTFLGACTFARIKKITCTAYRWPQKIRQTQN